MNTIIRTFVCVETIVSIHHSYIQLSCFKCKYVIYNTEYLRSLIIVLKLVRKKRIKQKNFISIICKFYLLHLFSIDNLFSFINEQSKGTQLCHLNANNFSVINIFFLIVKKIKNSSIQSLIIINISSLIKHIHSLIKIIFIFARKKKQHIKIPSADICLKSYQYNLLHFFAPVYSFI